MAPKHLLLSDNNEYDIYNQSSEMDHNFAVCDLKQYTSMENMEKKRAAHHFQSGDVLHLLMGWNLRPSHHQ